jgi:hypothetical protein
MKLKLVKPAQGLQWVRQGVLACRQQPFGFAGLLVMTAMAIVVLLGLPARIGAFLVVAAMPSVWMGFMLATRRTLNGERVTPDVMVEAFKGPNAPRRHFLLLGGAYVAATLLVLMLAQWLGPDPDELEAIMTSAKDAAELMSDPLVLQDMLLRLLLTVPVSLVFWHTPALILWARVPVPKALFFSAVATWRNLPAFIVYGACWFGLMLLVALLSRAVGALVPEPMIASVFAVVAGLWVAAAFYASLYFTVVDCFDPN